MRGGGVTMTDEELQKALKRLKVETGSLSCLGCGHEHNCSVAGCAIIREAELRVQLVASLKKSQYPKRARGQTKGWPRCVEGRGPVKPTPPPPAPEARRKDEID